MIIQLGKKEETRIELMRVSVLLSTTPLHLFLLFPDHHLFSSLFNHRIVHLHSSERPAARTFLNSWKLSEWKHTHPKLNTPSNKLLKKGGKRKWKTSDGEYPYEHYTIVTTCVFTYPDVLGFF